MPPARNDAISFDRLSCVAVRQVRWASAGTPQVCTKEAISAVLAFAPPAAPYVTEIKDGRCRASRSTASFTGANGASFRGGKISNETDGRPSARISFIFMCSPFWWMLNYYTKKFDIIPASTRRWPESPVKTRHCRATVTAGMRPPSDQLNQVPSHEGERRKNENKNSLCRNGRDGWFALCRTSHEHGNQ